MESQKPIHTLVLDTGAIIKNEPSISTLLAKSEALTTVPEIINEIKDSATRARVQTTLLPFLNLRSPSPISVKFVVDFARRTGDLAVLSKPDIQIIALTYELECERNGGDWRLRRMPGQKRVNGKPPAKDGAASAEGAAGGLANGGSEGGGAEGVHADGAGGSASTEASPPEASSQFAKAEAKEIPSSEAPEVAEAELASETKDLSISENVRSANDVKEIPADAAKIDSAQNSAESHEDSSDSDGGWITPSNLKKKQARDAGASSTQADEPKTMQAAVLTTDFAMQNVILQINLNLLSPSLTRVKHLKTFVLRCHACFQVTKEMSKQFCPKCGQPTLTRVSCSTSSNGEFKLHLKKNMQWNHRGERYSVPKPVSGAANGKVKGGGKGGWGNDLMLAEDQKEYQRATREEKKMKERSLMDEDYLPGILTGDRSRGSGRVKVGAGRNVNSRKR